MNPLSHQHSRLLGIGLVLCAACFVDDFATADDQVSFRRDIAPILQENCVACHGAKRAEGGYRLDTFDELGKPGDSGEPPIAAGDDAPGELLRRLKTGDEFERMPAESDPLSEQQIQLISKWIVAGAAFDGENRGDQLAFVIPAPKHVDPPESYPAPVPITALAFSPDSSRVYVGGYHEVTVWDTAEAKLADRIKNIGQRVYALAISEDGSTLAVACGEPGRGGELRMVDLASGEVRGVSARASDVLLDVAFRPGTDQVAVASADQTIRIVNTGTLEVVRTLSSHADWVTSVAWNHDGTRLASASRDKSAKVFDPETGQLLVSYQGHGKPVRAVTFSPDGKELFSTGADNKLHRWKIGDAKKVAELTLGAEGYKLVRGEGFLLIPCTDQRLRRIDIGNNKVVREFKGHEDWVLSAALHGEQSRAVSGSIDGEVRLWNTGDGTLIHAWLAKP